MTRTTLSLRVNRQLINLSIDRLIVAGWVGKDIEALQKHIDELAELGIEPPGRTPTYMSLSPDILTTAEEIGVIGAGSSGEVEAIVIKDREGKMFLGVGSDHTDRDFEKYGIPASKQMCAKPTAAEAWPFEDVRDHLDDLILRSWTKNEKGEKTLYQEGALAANRGVLELLQGIPRESIGSGEGFCLFCGTLPAIGGLRCSDYFEFELDDPLLNRSIIHSYRLDILPQFL